MTHVGYYLAPQCFSDLAQVKDLGDDEPDSCRVRSLEGELGLQISKVLQTLSGTASAVLRQSCRGNRPLLQTALIKMSQTYLTLFLCLLLTVCVVGGGHVSRGAAVDDGVSSQVRELGQSPQQASSVWLHMY